MKLCAWLFATTMCAGVLAWPAHGWAQIDSREGIALQNQIAELRQELQIMQQNQQNGTASPGYGQPPQGQYPQPAYGQPQGPVANGDTAAELVVRVGALEEQNRQLQGRIDDLTNELQHQHDDLTKQIGDLAFKLQNGSGGAARGRGGGGAAHAGDGAARRQCGAGAQGLCGGRSGRA
jgi:chaperonin cofactor prefoldin